MKILDTIQGFLDSVETKDFYKYIGACLSVIIFLMLFLIYRFYANVWEYQRQLRFANNVRSDVQELLEKAALVKQQKNDVHAMLDQNPNFKIAGYFQDVLTQLKLTGKEESSTVTTQERGEQEYDESVLTAKFNDMNMKELSELLNVLEQNKRIYTKSLEISRSRKANRSLEALLTIATLQPRT